MEFNLELNTPRWCLPLLAPRRYKGARGGRSSGKSHERAEALVEALILNPDTQAVCIREVQRSLKYSAKKLIETKIEDMGVGHLFEVLQTEIKRRGHKGLIIFQGMQDHTADSIKSLEGFDIAWSEESQSLSHRSIELLDPTMRKPGAELWFTWNPGQETDAVEKLFKDNEGPDSVVVHVNYTDNPWCPVDMIKLANRAKAIDYDKYNHIWLGGFNTRSDSQVFAGKWVSEEFTPSDTWDGPYFGVDFGFARDPTTGVKMWICKRTLYIEYDGGRAGLELDETARYLVTKVPGIETHTARADSARPESISYLKRHGLPRLTGVKKWPGSVADGVQFLGSFDRIVIHPRCEATRNEFMLYSYKVDRLTGDVLPDIVDDHNHYIDAIRYALQPFIQHKPLIFEAL